MNIRSKLVCLVGPSGVGKTSFAKRLVAKHNFALPTVVTTRQRRSDDDERYLHVSEAAFMEMIHSNCFLEWDKFSNHFYGTLLRSVEELANTGCHNGVVLDLTPRGCLKVKNAIPSAIVIALLPDDPAWLFHRLVSRNSQPVEETQARTDLLCGYLDEINPQAYRTVYVGFAPDSWDKTFEEIEKIIFESETIRG